MRNRLIFIATAAVAALLVSSCGGKTAAHPTGQTQRSGQSAAAAVTATVTYVEGEVLLNGKAAQIGDAVQSSDTITTGSDGEADIVFNERNIVQIGPGSVAVMNFALLGRGIQLQSGSIAAVLKNLAPTPSGPRFQVDTPTTVAGIRGTVFFVKVIDEDTTYECTCNGDVHLSAPNGDVPTESIAAHHHAVEYVRSGGQITVKPAGLEFHDDDEMNALAQKIGYTIDWSKADLTN